MFSGAPPTPLTTTSPVTKSRKTTRDIDVSEDSYTANNNHSNSRVQQNLEREGIKCISHLLLSFHPHLFLVINHCHLSLLKFINFNKLLTLPNWIQLENKLQINRITGKCWLNGRVENRSVKDWYTTAAIIAHPR